MSVLAVIGGYFTIGVGLTLYRMMQLKQLGLLDLMLDAEPALNDVPYRVKFALLFVSGTLMWPAWVFRPFL